jgi:hypothetical protein
MLGNSMSPNVVDGLIYLGFIGLLILTAHIAAVLIDKRNKQNLAKPDHKVKNNKSLEGEN